MAYEENLKTVTMIAGADLSSSQYLFVKMNTTNKTVVLCGDGEDGFGILQDAPTSGQACTIAIGGISKLKLGGTVAAGAIVSSGASGVGNVAATSDYAMGRAVTGGASGEIVSVAIDKNGIAA